jgi:hypothetical protein
MDANTDPASIRPENGSETEQELLEELETLQGRLRALDEPDEPDSAGDVGDSAETLRRADERTRVEDRIALIRRRLSPRPVPSGSSGPSTDDDR